MKKLCIVLAAFLIFFFAGNAVYASTFYLSPRNTSILSGDIVPVDVVINTNNESVNGVSAYLSYPKDLVEVEWITYGEAFSVQAEESYGDGLVKISRGSFLGEAGDVIIATIGFKGRAIGEAVVSFVADSAAPRTSDSSDSLNLSESTGATFTVGLSQVESNVNFCFLLECIL